MTTVATVAHGKGSARQLQRKGGHWRRWPPAPGNLRERTIGKHIVQATAHGAGIVRRVREKGLPLRVKVGIGQLLRAGVGTARLQGSGRASYTAPGAEGGVEGVAPGR